MQLSSQIDAGKGSHLYVLISGGCLSCVLVYADYDSGESYSEYSSVLLPKYFQLESFDDFLKNYLELWEDDIGWSLINDGGFLCVSDTCEREDGVGGATLLLSEEYHQEGFRSLLLSCVAQLFGSKEQIDAAGKSIKGLGYSHMIYVIANWDEITVLVLSRATKSNVNIHGSITANEFRMKLADFEPKIEKRLSSLLSVNLERNVLKDMVANLFARRTNSSISVETWDILRALITASLLNFNDASFRRFGIETDAAALVITGDMVKVMPQNHAFIAVVDGLQLRGRYEVVVDREYRFMLGGADSDVSGFICPLKELYPHRYLYLSTERGGSGRHGRPAFWGRIKSYKDEKSGVEKEVSIVGQTGSINMFDVKGGGKLYIKPEKSAYFPNLKKEKKDLTHEFGDRISKIIIDCRKIPVVYGPDVETNNARLSDWIRSLHLT